jgi:hypothetical protein
LFPGLYRNLIQVSQVFFFVYLKGTGDFSIFFFAQGILFQTDLSYQNACHMHFSDHNVDPRIGQSGGLAMTDIGRLFLVGA